MLASQLCHAALSSVRDIAIGLYHLSRELTFLRETGYRVTGALWEPVAQTTVGRETLSSSAATAFADSRTDHPAR